MKKAKYVYLGLLSILICIAICMTFVTQSFSYGLYTEVTGKPGSYVLNYFDSSSGTPLSCDVAYEYYGTRKYTYHRVDDETIYFYNCKQTTKSAYETGYPREEADIRARNKGDAGIRVRSTAEAKAAIDNIYKNYRTGDFYFEFAPNENLNWNEIEKYVKEKYGVVNYKQNYYPYSKKGEFEPIRYGLLDINSASTGTVRIEGRPIRISGNEKLIADSFVTKLLPYLQGDGSDYQKILATYSYIVNNTSYYVDDGYDNFLDSNTSIYDVFILKLSNCIGYSIAFSYIMDKMGIESYIVDQIVTNDPVNRIYDSVHTYNVVKLDGKFYVVDLTGGRFLTGLSASTLYDGKLNTSTTTYNFAGKPRTYTFESGLYNKIYSQVKTIKTTTTRKIVLTTTTAKTTHYEGETTTLRFTTPSRQTTTDVVYPIPTSTKTTTNYQTTTKGEEVVVPTNPRKKTTSTTTQSGSGTQGSAKEPSDKTVGNIVLIGIGIVVIVFYFIYRNLRKGTTGNPTDEVNQILNEVYNRK